MKKSDLTGDFLNCIITDIKQDIELISVNAVGNRRNVLNHLRDRVNMLEDVAAVINSNSQPEVPQERTRIQPPFDIDIAQEQSQIEEMPTPVEVPLPKKVTPPTQGTPRMPPTPVTPPMPFTPPAQPTPTPVTPPIPETYKNPATSPVPGTITPKEGLRTFTLEELSKYDGKNGQPGYIAINGIVYDITNDRTWVNAEHFGLTPGKDLTIYYRSCHSGKPALDVLPIVGQLVP